MQKKGTMIKAIEHRKMFVCAACVTALQSFLSVCVAFLLEALVNAAGEGNMDTLGKIFAVICGYVVISIVVIRLSSEVSNRYVATQSAALREFLMVRLFEKPVGDYQSFGVGNALAMIENDVSLLEKNYYRAGLSLISLITTFLFGLVSMFLIDWKIALSVVATSMLPVIFSAFYSKPLKRLHTGYSDSYSRYMTALKNALSNYSLIKVFHIESMVLPDVSAQCKRQEHEKKKYQAHADRVEGYTSLLSFAVVIAVFGVGTLLII